MIIQKLSSLLPGILLWLSANASAGPVRLAGEGRALRSVIVAEKASASTKATAAELAGNFTRISGAKFSVETGDGSRGIVVGAAADFTKLPFAAEFRSPRWP